MSRTKSYGYNRCPSRISVHNRHKCLNLRVVMLLATAGHTTVDYACRLKPPVCSLTPLGVIPLDFQLVMEPIKGASHAHPKGSGFVANLTALRTEHACVTWAERWMRLRRLARRRQAFHQGASRRQGAPRSALHWRTPRAIRPTPPHPSTGTRAGTRARARGVHGTTPKATAATKPTTRQARSKTQTSVRWGGGGCQG